MSAIFKIKPWLTAEDAAKYINLETKQDIKSSDIYDLAVDLKLKVYVRFHDDIQCYLQGFNASPNSYKVFQPDYYQLNISSRTIKYLKATSSNESTPLLLGKDLKLFMSSFRNLSPFDLISCEVDCHSEPDIIFKTQDIESLIQEIIPTYNPEEISHSNTENGQLGKKKEKTLLMTIGALAKLAAHLGGNDVGSFEKPIACQLRNKLEREGELLPYGLGESNWIERINEGVKIYNKERDKEQEKNKNSK